MYAHALFAVRRLSARMRYATPKCKRARGTCHMSCIISRVSAMEQRPSLLLHLYFMMVLMPLKVSQDRGDTKKQACKSCWGGR